MGCKAFAAALENAPLPPSAAISGRGANASVTLVRDGKQVRTPVVTGVVGDSTTQLLGGVRAGDELAISSSPLGASGLSGLAAALGGGGGRFGGGAGGGPVVFGGGPP